MTEEQFWRSNPRIIKVWEKIFKDKENHKNHMIHTWVGSYGLSALFTAIDGCLNGKKAKSKYIKEPIQLFPLTEEEQKIKQEKERAKFVNWAKMAQIKYKEKGG